MTLAQSEEACLVIADISGYTSYLTGTELEHAQDVIADLMEVLISGLEPTLTLAKLEGDAVFCYTTEPGLDGSLLLDLIEATYLAFRRRIRSVRQASTCECDACAMIPSLDVKFCVHTGSLVRQRVARQEELAGGDVILVHRLLKNTVSEKLGSRAYAALTATACKRLDLDPRALAMIEHEETYEHLGVIALFLVDLQSAWERVEGARREFLSADAADFTVALDIPGPPALVWDYLTTPTGYRAVAPYIIRDEHHGSGRRGVGSVTHCVHGGGSHVEEILEWRPFEDFTYMITDPNMGDVRVTIELTARERETSVRFSVRLETPGVRAVLGTPEFAAGMSQYALQIEGWLGGIRQAAGRAVSEMAVAAGTTRDARTKLIAASQRYRDEVAPTLPAH